MEQKDKTKQNTNVTNYNKSQSLKSQVYNVEKEKREKEMADQRESSYAFLNDVCQALDERIKAISIIRTEADSAHRKTTKEETNISTADIIAWFGHIGKEYPEKNPVNTLVSILVDLARCQVNTKLLDYHVAIRLVYFGEKFQAYFSKGYDEKRLAFTLKYLSLFNSWNCSFIGFTNDESLDMPNVLLMSVNSVGCNSER